MWSPPDSRRAIAWAASALAVCAGAGRAQDTTATGRKPPACVLYTGLSYVYDSNIDHSQPGLKTFGGLAGLGGECRFGSRGARLNLGYDGLLRRYAGTSIWNVPGHDVQLALTGLVTRHWAVGSVVQVAINGSTEDRVLRNEYSSTWQLEYRFTHSNRLQLYGEYLVKAYPNPLGHTETDPRVGGVLRLGERWSVAVGGRYEVNWADSSRYRYRGPLLDIDLTIPVGPWGNIASSTQYRIRNFASRRIRVNGTEVLRRDSDFVATVAWHQPVGHWEVVFGYRFERFRSNDARRVFREHVGSMTLNRWW
jgi:hypothetical protein